MPRIRRAIIARPPTTPPTIAPTGVECEGDAGDVGGIVVVVVEVSVSVEVDSVSVVVGTGG
jgi:hypothetical protein